MQMLWIVHHNSWRNWNRIANLVPDSMRILCLCLQVIERGVATGRAAGRRAASPHVPEFSVGAIVRSANFAVRFKGRPAIELTLMLYESCTLACIPSQVHWEVP